MALINCPKCSGTVSTKALACPHCGFTSVNVLSEKERMEKLADELGSMSAALATLEEKNSMVPQTPIPTQTPELQTAVPSSSDVKPPKREYTTADIILNTVACAAVVMFFGPALIMIVRDYFAKPSSALQSNPTPNGTYIPPGDWQLKVPPPSGPVK